MRRAAPGVSSVIRFRVSVHIRPSVVLRAGAPAPVRPDGFAHRPEKRPHPTPFDATGQRRASKKTPQDPPRALQPRPLLDRNAVIRLRRILHTQEKAAYTSYLLRLVPMEFLRRFLQHVLPSRFCKVRHYGLHHSSKRATIKLLQAAMSFALGRDLPKPPEIEPLPLMTCPRCEAVMTFERRYTPNQRLSFESASPRGPP